MNLDHLHFVFGKMSIQFFYPFLNQFVWFSDAELYALLIYAVY